VRAPQVSYETTVLKAAEKRMADAAVLLARLWASAYRSGGSPHFGPTVVRFKDLRVLDSYPVPDYLPASASAAAPHPTPAGGAVETITAVADLLSHTRAFDGKLVCLKGRTATLFRKTSRAGNAYYTFWLNDGESKVRVFKFGVPETSEGEESEACGRFASEKHVSGRIFFDELSAEVLLKGKAMGAGYVDITGAGVLPVKH
jgi:hypothetical protein